MARDGLHTGPRGMAIQLGINDKLPGADTTVTWWLLTGTWHPIWPQFVISVVTLADKPGRPAAHLHFPGATHELVVMALNPGDGKTPAIHLPGKVAAVGLGGVGGWLEPIDVVHQFTATDDEMTTLADLCAKACVGGALTPSTDDARTAYREAWLQACVKTLAHIRGEQHAP